MPEPVFYKLGEKKSGINTSTGKVEDFNELRDKCLRDKTLFEDDSFPAIDSSFYLTDGKGRRAFNWIRPSELVKKPLFISEGANRFDVCQGELGNCWLLAAVANLTLNEKLFQRVVPHDQTFDKPSYAGIFHFRFWQYGRWIDVVVDDRLPTINANLMLMHSKDKNEFWSALLEKAYAKLHGSYEALKGGTTCEAMEDFTGGLAEYFDLQSNECPTNLMQIMLKAYDRSSFLGCSIEALDSSQMESQLANGLIRGHAYSVTAVKLVQLSTSRLQGKIPLIRVRNPWGNEAEWKGAWSDKSREWTVVSDREKQDLGLTFDADGEFWITFTDFKNNFTGLEICNLSPDSLDDDLQHHWEVSYFEGSWIRGISAGGCRNHLSTFHLNPQYFISLVDHDEDDGEDLCTCVVALMQKNHRTKKKMGLDRLTIGFAVYEIEDGDGHAINKDPASQSKSNTSHQLLTADYFKYNASVARSQSFINLREVNGRFRLKPGKYCIIPSTFDPNQEGEFLIRFFTEKPPQSVAENDVELGLVDTNTDKKNIATDKLVGDNELEQSDRNQAHNDDANASNSLFTTCWNVFHKTEVSEKVRHKEAKTTKSSINSFFAKLAGEDMEVDATELQQIMNYALKKEFKFDGFSLESCRSMIAMLEDDETGKLGFDEFTKLWRNLRHWCSVFKKHDIDSSNTISAHELRTAYHKIGLNVNRQILQLLLRRYGIIPNKKDKNTEKALSFDDFIHSSIKLKHSIDIWNEKSKVTTYSKPGSALPFGSPKYASNVTPSGPTFTLEEFVKRIIYC